MVPTALIPWLDPELIIKDAGPWALLVVCVIVFAETGLLVGFLLPGDTLLIITGLLAFTPGIFVGDFRLDIWWVAIAIGLAAFLGGEVGYLIGHRAGPRIFERKETGLFSIENVKRTNAFFDRFGGFAVIVARFVPIVRTFAPVAAGVGHMNYRKYSLYNFIGALVWGVGLTTAGYLLARFIPAVGDLVREYIDVILLCAVAIAVIPTVFHYIQSTVKARRKRNAGVPTDAQVEALVLDEKKFDQKLGD